MMRKVERSNWASSVVVVPKADGKLCLYGDYKMTINQETIDWLYPLPTAEDIFATLTGGEHFLIILYLIINTLKGLYEVLRLL